VKANKLILFFLLCTGFASAQSPGYLGKKTMIGISGGLTSNYSSFTQNYSQVKYNGDLRTSFISFTPNFGFHIKRVLNRKSTLDFSYTQSYNGIYKSYDIFNTNLSTRTQGNYFDYQRAKTSIYTLALSETGATSPIGLYLSYGASFMVAKMEAIDINGAVYPLENYHDISLFLSTGTRRVFADKIMVDFGIDGNLFFYGLLNNVNSLASPEETTLDETIPYIIFYNNLLSCRLSVSYLF
jgi:hypothetical protein